MAAWHFTTKVLPLLGLERIHGIIPNVLSEERFEFGNITDEAPETRAVSQESYWHEFHYQTDLEQQLALLLPKSASWSDSAKMFGTELGSRIVIWNAIQSGLISDIVISYSLSALDSVFVCNSLDVIRSFQCVLLAVQNGFLFYPDIPSFIAQAKLCSAARYTDSHSLDALQGDILR